MTVTVGARFHLAFPVNDLDLTRTFYRDLLGCTVGRSAERWIDFDFFGHQISAHLSPEECGDPSRNEVDHKAVPVRHFGAILPWDDWVSLRHRLEEEGIDWVIEPYLRFAGEAGEQGTMFIRDPSGNCLEFKTFRDMAQVFAE